MSIAQRPVPQVSGEEVLVKIKACGLCGTDQHSTLAPRIAAQDALELIMMNSPQRRGDKLHCPA